MSTISSLECLICGSVSDSQPADYPATLWGLLTRHELLQLLGMPVDIVTPKVPPEKFWAKVLADAVAV